MNKLGGVHSNLRVTLNLHEAQFVHTLMNVHCPYHIPYNGIFSCRQIFAVLSQKHGDYFSRILIFAVGNVREK